MNTVNNHNAKPSVAPSATNKSSVAHGPTFTEEDYLSQQAALAKLSMRDSISRLQRHFGQGIKPQAWFKAHPVATTSAAVVGGLAVARMIFGRKRVHHYSSEAFPGNGHAPVSSGPSLMTRLITDAIRVGLPALISSLAAAKANTAHFRANAHPHRTRSSNGNGLGPHRSDKPDAVKLRRRLRASAATGRTSRHRAERSEL